MRAWLLAFVLVGYNFQLKRAGVAGGDDPLWGRRPQTWLLRVGWKRHGLISYREVPGRH
jgi:hypothetical protein